MSRPVFRFAAFRLDAATRELRRDGASVILPPRSFDCIAYLVQHRDRAVGRDELVSAVWGKTSVTDTVLGKAILGARRALDDQVDAPRFIRTVSRFGYHWIAPVTESVDDATTGAAAMEVVRSPATMATPTPARSRRARFQVIGAMLALGAVAAVFLGYRALAPSPQERIEASPAGEKPAQTDGWTAAVLPATISGRDEDEWLRFGVMDLVAVRLRGAGIPTMPSDALLRLVPGGTGADSAARTLREVAHVQQIIVPTARRAGTGWAIRLALMRPEGITLEVEEQAVDAILATHAAVDRLMQRLGVAAGTRERTGEQLSLDELLQRLEAARLGDDLAGMRKLVAQAPPAMAAKPEVRLRLAQLDLRAGDFDEALHTLAALLADVSAEAAPGLRAQVLYAQGTAFLLATQHDRARLAYDEGIALVERHAEPDVAAKLYMGRGNLSALQGRYGEAEADHARARIAFQLADDLFTTFWLDGNEGALQNRLGHPAAALPLLRRAELHFERFNVFNELATTQANEVVSHLALVQPVEALAASERAMATLEHVADPSLHRLVRLRRAMALVANGHLADARALLTAIMTTSNPADEASLRGMAHAVLARIAHESADPGLARNEARAAVEQLIEPSDMQMRAQAWLLELDALRRLGLDQEAALSAEAFDDWAMQARNRLVTQSATLARAGQAAATAQYAVAERSYEEALQQAVALDLPRALVETAVAYAGFLLDRGSLEPAITIAGRISRFAEQDYQAAMLQARLYQALGHKEAEALARGRVERLIGDRAPAVR